jgi:putative membrane protein
VIFLNAIRGFLIGVAEVIPGISGGTVALIVSIYEQVVSSVANAAKGFLAILRGKFALGLDHFKKIDWKLLVPLLLGMFSAIFLTASLIENLLKSQPENMQGLFAGLMLASLYVPYRLASNGWSVTDYLVAVAAALAACFSFWVW